MFVSKCANLVNDEAQRTNKVKNSIFAVTTQQLAVVAAQIRGPRHPPNSLTFAHDDWSFCGVVVKKTTCGDF